MADHLRASAPAWRGWLERGSREDLSSRLETIEVPVRIAVGWEDKSITGSLVDREIRARLRRTESSLGFLRGVGRLLPLEAPEATAAFLHGACAPFEPITTPSPTLHTHGT